jgi:hypothetical protein
MSHLEVEFEAVLQPAVSRTVSLDVWHSSGAHGQIFITIRLLRFFYLGALSDERICVYSTSAAGPRQPSISRVRAAQNL